MTASRYKVPPSLLRQAGNRFGLDLGGFFSGAAVPEGSADAGTDTGGSTEGGQFANVSNTDGAWAGYLPTFGFQSLSKGRGGNVLGYKGGLNRDTQINTMTLAPEPATGINLTNINQVGVNTEDGVGTGDTYVGTDPEEDPNNIFDSRRDLGDLATEFGQSGLFGGMDYKKALDAGYEPGEIQDWMRDNLDLVHEQNRPGMAGGLYEQISGGVPTEQIGSVSRTWSQGNRPEIELGQSGDYFGHADLEAARGAGFQDSEIKRYLIDNPQLLREGNVPGQGGLFDELGDTIHGQYANTPERDPISIRHGASAAFFGGRDLDAARGAGYSDTEIKAYLDQNIGLLRDANVPGGGGLYDKLGSSAQVGYGVTPDRDERDPIGIGGGQSAAYFGDVDLQAAKGAGWSDEEIKSYLDQNPSLLRAHNVPGGGGLYDNLSGGNGGNGGGSISLAHGQSADYFGHADLEAARNQGKSNQEIKAFLDANIDKLRGPNVPGGGGVYDMVR